MYVSKLKVDGLRSFTGRRSVNLDFTRPDGSYAGWTVLAGRNGSGKTTLLQAIALALAGENFLRDPDTWPGTLAKGRATIGVTVIQSPGYDGGLDFGSWEFDVQWRRDDEDGQARWFGAAAGKRRPPRHIGSSGDGWFYAGYGPFRRLSASALGRSEPRSQGRYAGLRTLFDEDVSLVEGVSWLIEQHLYRLEKQSGAQQTLDAALAIIGDGMLPDNCKVSRVDSKGLWVERGAELFPLRQMSDGYRTVTALVVDIIRQMSTAFESLRITYQGNTPTLAYPGIVLVDEMDAHLHVSWQKGIGHWLKTHFPLIQFIVTSHSPYICQSADPGGLVRLAGPEDPIPPQVVDQELYQRVIYGSGDDAILTELFGVETPYSTEGERLRARLAYLEDRLLRDEASPRELEEYSRLTETLTSSVNARIDEITARL
jgi:energy-coupling factor transporter ATP-binding protein EcfA2